MAEIRVANESLVENLPVTIRRRVKWGECDPAGVVHMVNYGEYVVSAYEMLMAELLGEEFQKAKAALCVALPARAYQIDFIASLRPDDEFIMTAKVSNIRVKTFDVVVRGRSINCVDLFHATITPIAVRPSDRSAIPLPEGLVRELDRYRAACAAAIDA